jgi:hypothetical protein
MKKRVRDYVKEDAWENQPEQVAERVARNKARRHMAKEGKVHKGDNLQVDHIDSNPLHNTPKNWRAISAHRNQSMNKHDRKKGKK